MTYLLQHGLAQESRQNIGFCNSVQEVTFCFETSMLSKLEAISLFGIFTVNTAMEMSM